jgi:hypothetical protein
MSRKLVKSVYTFLTANRASAYFLREVMGEAIVEELVTGDLPPVVRGRISILEGDTNDPLFDECEDYEILYGYDNNSAESPRRLVKVVYTFFASNPLAANYFDHKMRMFFDHLLDQEANLPSCVLGNIEEVRTSSADPDFPTRHRHRRVLVPAQPFKVANLQV